MFEDVPLNGTLDVPGPTETVERALCQLFGWVLARDALIDRVEIRIDGVPYGLARLGLPRHDLAPISELPHAVIAGFSANLDLSHLSGETNHVLLELTAYDCAGRSFVFPPRLLRLRPVLRMAQNYLAGHPQDFISAPARQVTSGRRLKVACFTHDLGFGGGQLYLTELLRQMLRLADFDCTVIAPKDGPLGPELESQGMRVETLPIPLIPDAEQFSMAVSDLARWQAAHNFDVVIGNTIGVYAAILAANQAGIPSIWAIHESYSLSLWCALNGGHEQPVRIAMTARIRSALRVASFVVFEAEATKQMFSQYADEDHLLKLPYGVDIGEIDRFLADFDRDAARHRLGLRKTDRLITSIGTFESRKQQTVLAQAFAEVSRNRKDARLFMVGDFPSAYSTSLHAYLERLKLGGQLVTVPIMPEIFSSYAISDVFALISDTESMPRTLLESMCFGLPPLAADAYGVSELITDGVTGFLVEVNRLSKLVDKLDYVLSIDQSELRSIGERAAKTIRQAYDSQNYARSYLDLIDKLVPSSLHRKVPIPRS